MAAAAIAAGIAPAVPGPGANAGPAARLAVGAAPTRLTRPGVQLAPLAPDEVALPKDSPVVQSLRYLQWTVPAAAGPATIALAEIQGLCLMVAQFDLKDANVRQTLSAANLIEHALSLAACSDLLRELHEAQVFEDPYDSDVQLFEALADNPRLDHNRLRPPLAAIERTDPFDRPGAAAVPARPAGQGRRGAPAVAAIPAVPPMPGPSKLKGLQLTSWLAILSEGERQLPGRQSLLLARTVTMLSHRSRDSTRREATSDLRTVAATLTMYVSTWAGVGTGATSSQISRQIPAYLASNMSVMPADLVGPCGTALACEAELRDGHTLLCGRETEAASVLWRRIHHNLDRFPVLSQFKGRMSSSGATKEMLERLMIGTKVPAGTPLVRTWELARDLDRKGKLQAVRDLLAAGSTVSKVVEDLLESHVTAAGAATVPDSGGGAFPPGGGGSTSGSMEQREFERAVSAPNFISAHEEMQRAEGRDVIEAAATSGSVLMLRYLFWAPAWMRPRHPAFDMVGKNLDDRASYLEYCATVSAESGEVPSHLATYRLADTQVDEFWSCRWADIDMVNANPQHRHEGGFLAVRFLEHGQAYEAVTAADFYTVESSLLGVREWFSRLLLGVGFSAAPDEGYSWNDVIDRQLELVRYMGGLPTQDMTSWRRWANDNFRKHALMRAQTLFRSKLSTSRPADEVVTSFLPEGASFFANITAKLADAQPIAVVRRAFPNYFPATLVALPGTSSTASRAGGGETSAGGERVANTSGLASGSAKAKGGKGKMRDQMDTPGSKADLAKTLSSGHLFIAARVCDIQAVAEHYKVKREDHCWPVIFSTKKGEAALALCPNPDKHGGIHSKWHRPPKGFDQAQAVKKFWSAANAEQLREAGWRNAKKSKT